MCYHSVFRDLAHRCVSKSARSKPRTAQRRRESRRLLLEPLEGRRLLAFNVMAEYSSGNSFPYDLLLTQINADNQLDMVVVNSNGSVSVRLGNADGTFGGLLDSPTGSFPGSVAAGDFNGDGITDLVTTSSGGLSLLLGNGDGSFAPPQAIAIPGQSISTLPELGLVPQHVRSVAVGDLNGDGHLDLVAAGETSYWSCGHYYCDGPFGDGYVNVLLGDGNGGFSAPEVHHLGESRWPADIAIDDFNNDGQPDVMTADGTDLSVLLGDGSGALASPIHSGLGRSISLGDIDGDGNLDVITYGGPSLIVQKGQGDGSFVPSTPIDMSNGIDYYNVDSVVVGDVNGDGKLDLVAVGRILSCGSYGYYNWCYDDTSTRQSSVILGNGLGGFSAPILSSLGPADYHYRLFGAELADLTGDGLPELVMIDSNTGLAIVARNDGNWAELVALSISSPSVIEENQGTVSAVFTVTLASPSQQIVSVNYATSDLDANEEFWYGGTAATAGLDYIATSGTLTIPAGQTSGTITVLVIGDRLGEPNELFFVDLTDPSFATIANPRAIGTIIDDEPYVSMEYYSDPAVVEGDSGTTPMVFTVVLSAAYDVPVTVDYFTSDGTATAGSDYHAAAGTVTFAAGETSQTLTVQVMGDTQQEDDEYFYVNLTNATHASIGSALKIGYILNDDTPPTLSIHDASIVEGNSGTQLMTFTVTLSNASGAGVWVNYVTANGTAKTSDNDYVATSGSLYFSPGETSKTISVSIKGDTKKEKDERFYVNLSGAIGATIADGQGVGTILNDDGGTRGNAKSSNQELSASAVNAAILDWMFPALKKRGR